MTKTFNLHFTDFCNFHCKHCFVKKNGKELSFEDIMIIGKKLADYKKKNNINVRVNLAGGEPLLSKNIQSIIDYLCSIGLEVSIITNGYYLTDEFIINNKNKLSMIGISVDSINHDTNIRIGRCCNNITLSKEELIHICKSIKDNGIKLKINTCVTSINKDEDINELLDIVNPNRTKVLRAFCDGRLSIYNISNEDWNIIKTKYNNVLFEDNDFMRISYLIIDSEGNLSNNNLHATDNSLLNNTVEECLENLKGLERQQ